jgi:hypothetical protein
MKVCPELTIIWIENDPVKIFFARFEKIMRLKFLKWPIFRKADFFTTDLQSADVVFLYVPRNLLPKLFDKFQKELKNGATVIIYRIDFPEWRVFDTIKTDRGRWVSKNNIFIYRIGEECKL